MSFVVSLVLAVLTSSALVPAAAAQPVEDPERCRGARAFLEAALGMATVAEPDSITDVRTRRTLPGCRVTAAGVTTVYPAATARRVFGRLRQAEWVRTPDPLDSPNESSLRFRSQGVDCLFTYISGGLLSTDAALAVDSLVVPDPGERRYNVVVRCVPALPAAPG